MDTMVTVATTGPQYFTVEVNTTFLATIPGHEISQMDEIIGYMYFYCTLVMSVLSMIGSVVIILSNACTAESKTTGRKILMYLSVADFLTAFGNLVGIVWYANKDSMSENSSDSMCEFHASLTIFSSISSYFWTVFMTLFLYLCTVMMYHGWDTRLLYAGHVTCWLFPAVVAITVLAMDVIGWTDLPFPSWCWIDTDLDKAVLWQYLSGKLWEILSFGVTVVMITIIKVKLIKQLRRRNRTITESSIVGKGHKPKKNVISETNKKLTFVPVIFLLCRVWGMVRFIVTTHFPTATQEGIGGAIVALLQGLGDSAQGFANCILFILTTDKFKQKLKKDLHIHCHCQKNCNMARCCGTVDTNIEVIQQSSTETEQREN